MLTYTRTRYDVAQHGMQLLQVMRTGLAEIGAEAGDTGDSLADGTVVTRDVVLNAGKAVQDAVQALFEKVTEHLGDHDKRQQQV